MFLDYTKPAPVAPMNAAFGEILAACSPERPAPLPINLTQEEIRQMVRDILG